MVRHGLGFKHCQVARELLVDAKDKSTKGRFVLHPIVTSCVDDVPSDSPSNHPWLASLSLAFSGTDHGTRLRFLHEGPLRIQKALYPEGRDCCHAVIVHPPGGIAAGDRLVLDIDVSATSHAVVTTPSATKWYGAFDGSMAEQFIEMQVHGVLEWLPAETIVFDAAQVSSDIVINASDQASMMGWDLLVFGRQGSGERFKQGQFSQTLKVDLGGASVWTDRLVILGDDPLFDSPVGLDGHHTVATFWAIAREDRPWPDTVLDELRAVGAQMAFTVLHPRLLVGRQVGETIELNEMLKRVRAFMRPHVCGAPAMDLRLWAT